MERTMTTFDPYPVFDFLKSNIYLIALCLFLAIGSAKLILEELISLVILYKRLKFVIRSELPPEMRLVVRRSKRKSD
jgi:hypothetical protein